MMRRSILISVIFLINVFAHLSYAQDTAQAQFTAELGSPLIGEPISLLFTLDVPAGTTINLPQFPPDWPPFVVREVGEVMMVSNAGRDVYQQYLTVILWQPGDYQTPDITIDYQLPNSDIIQQVRVQPAYFAVKSILGTEDLTLRPLKPPASLLYISPLLVVMAAIGLILIGAYAWKWRERRMQSRTKAAKTDNLHVSARLALTDLRQITERKMASAKVYMIAGNTLRRYVQGRFAIPAEEMTTEELLASLMRRSDLSERRQRELIYLLEQADLVKFAHLSPQPKSAEKMVDVAQRWVMAVEQDHVETIG